MKSIYRQTKTISLLQIKHKEFMKSFLNLILTGTKNRIIFLSGILFFVIRVSVQPDKYLYKTI